MAPIVLILPCYSFWKVGHGEVGIDITICLDIHQDSSCKDTVKDV